MANNYKILRKTNLSDDLFLGGEDAAAWEQEEADRDWARELESRTLEAAPPRELRNFQGRIGPAPEREPEPLRQLFEAKPVEAVEVEDAAPTVEAQALVKTSTPGRGWAEVLADLTGNPAIEGAHTIGVCALESSTASSEATAAIAHWVAQLVRQPALVVEAHFGSPRLCRAFALRNIGVADAILRNEELSELIQEAAGGSLKVLAAGDFAGARERRKGAADFPVLFRSLRESFSTVIVELPAVDDPAFERLPIAAIADAVILTADSRTARMKQLTRAAETLREANARLAATMLDAPQTLSAHLRRSRLAQQFHPAHGVRTGSQLGI